MPWWSWILIWVLLVLILLAALAGGAWYLWRKARALLEASSEAAAALGDARGDGEPRRFTPPEHGQVPVGLDAAFSDPVQVRALRQEGIDARKSARRERRIASLYANGRPRRVGDLEEARDHQHPAGD